MVPVSLVLLDGNGSNYVKVDWKLATINANGDKVNKREQKSSLYDLKSDKYHNRNDFDNYMTRASLDTQYTFGIDNRLVLHCEIAVKVDKDLHGEFIEAKEQTKNLKRKLELKEEENGKIQSDYEQYKKRSRDEIEKLKKDNLAAIEKCKKEEGTRSNELRSAHELQLNDLQAKIASLSKDKIALEKCLKAEKERSTQLSSNVNRLQGKLAKLSNSVRNSAKLADEIEDKSAGCSAKMGMPSAEMMDGF